MSISESMLLRSLEAEVKKRPPRLVAQFLNYAFGAIHFDYSRLTQKEKSFCTESEFQQLCEWVRSNR